MKHTILLFDMDGVLLFPKGYNRALQISVNLVGRNLGIANPQLDMKHISTFEAAGVTHVWDLMVIFTAFQLIQVWKLDPSARVPDNINLNPKKFVINGTMDYTKFIQKLDLSGIQPLAYAEAILANLEASLSVEQTDYLKLILFGGQDLCASPVLPLLQEYILGSQEYSQTYNCASQLNTESIPLKYNQTALTEYSLDKLTTWLESPFHHAAIFTNRPSKPPDGVLRFFSTPEAEIGANSIGLQKIPIIGVGSLAWLAEQRTKPVLTYLKPHPVHALAAMQAAMGTPIPQALELAADIANGSGDIADWLSMRDSDVYAFEDSPGGLVSVQEAKKLLNKNKIYSNVHLVGVSKRPEKIKTLSQIADQVIQDINNGLLAKLII